MTSRERNNGNPAFNRVANWRENTVTFSLDTPVPKRGFFCFFAAFFFSACKVTSAMRETFKPCAESSLRARLSLVESIVPLSSRPSLSKAIYLNFAMGISF